MNRLDSVLGPENWWDDYVPIEHGVICRLSIRLPDGQVITKVDAGGEAGMSDLGDNDKSGFSDALKRAAVKFGVGRYLYRDGVADLGDQPKAPAEASASPGKPTITTGYQLFKFAESCKIDPRLAHWITATFTEFPAKISNWSQPQVAAALPEIRSRLEAIKAQNQAAA